MPNDQEMPCARCGGAVDEASRVDGLIHAGYGSRHDTAAFAVINESAVPQGQFCDGCLDALVSEGAIVLTGHFGKLEQGLPAAAYAQFFRAGEVRMAEVFEKSRAPEEILLALAPLSGDDPFRAGMMAALLDRLGLRMDHAAARYGEAMEADQRERVELLTLMLDSIGPTMGSA